MTKLTNKQLINFANKLIAHGPMITKVLEEFENTPPLSPAEMKEFEAEREAEWQKEGWEFLEELSKSRFEKWKLEEFYKDANKIDCNGEI